MDVNSGWLRVLKYGLMQLPYKIAAPFVVPFLSKDERRSHPKFGNTGATDLGWWNIGVRNSCGNYEARPMPAYRTSGQFKGDETLEKVPGWQWRVRHSIEYNASGAISDVGRFRSFRFTFGPVRPQKGKWEFYVGYKMDSSEKVMRLTFFQLRTPFNPILYFILGYYMVTGIISLFS